MGMTRNDIFDTQKLSEPTLMTFDFRVQPDPDIPCLRTHSIVMQPGARDFGAELMAMTNDQINPAHKILPFAWGRMGGGTNTAAYALLGYLFGREVSDALGTQFAQQVISCLNSGDDSLSSTWTYRWVKDRAKVLA